MALHFRLVIRGNSIVAQSAAFHHGFKRVTVRPAPVSGGGVTVLHIEEFDPVDAVVAELENWLRENGGNHHVPGSLISWARLPDADDDIDDIVETITGSRPTRAASKRGPKIIDDLDGVRATAGYDYYTVIVPPSAQPTRWHGSTALSRGAFDDEAEAHAWARKHLAGQPYTLKLIKGWATARTKIIRDLDGFGDTPRWATVRSRRT